MWTLYPDGSVRRDVDGVIILPDPNSDLPAQRDYQAFLAGRGTPTPLSSVSTSSPASTVTGNQWTFALKDLGLGSAWRAARARSKPDDQSRVELIARDTPLLASDPLLVRVAGNAGTSADGSAVIDVPTVFAHAQGMPL